MTLIDNLNAINDCKTAIKTALEKEAVESYNRITESLGGGRKIYSYDEFLRENHAERGLRGLLAHGSDYYKYPPTGGTYDLTDDPNFS